MPRSIPVCAAFLVIFAAADQLGSAEPRAYGGKAAARWIQDLSNASANTRAIAAKALAEVGGDEAVAPLLERLRDPDGDTRLNAAYALGRIGEQPDKTIAALIRLCRDRDEHVRYSAQWSLGQIAGHMHPAADAAADDLDQMRRLLASAASAVTETGAPEGIRQRIQAAGEAIPKAMAATRPIAPAPAPVAESHSTPSVPSPNALLNLLRELRSNDAFVAMQGLAALKRLEPVSLPLVLQSVAAGREESHLLGTLPEALAELGQPVVPSLIEGLAHGDDAVRALVTEVIGQMGPRASETLPALAALLADEHASDELREKVMASLKDIGPAAAGTTRNLAALVNDAKQPEGIRVSAALALAGIGPRANAAQAALVQVLRSTSEPRDLRTAAAEALAKVCPNAPTTAQVLLQGLAETDDAELQAALITASCALGPAARPLLPKLIELLDRDDIDDSLRQKIAESLGSIGPAAETAIPALVRVLTETDCATCAQVASAIALGKIGPTAVRALEGQSHHADPVARLTVIRALAEIGPTAAPCVECLLHTLTNDEEEEEARTQAAIALSRIGAPASAAIPALVKLVQTKETSEPLRATCALALGAIDPTSSAVLTAALQDPCKRVQIAAAYSLHKLRCEGSRVLDQLVSLLADEDDQIVNLSQQALEDVGQDAIPIVTIASKDKSRDLGLRLRCVETLGRLGQKDGLPLPTAQAAVHPLLEALSDEELAETATSSLTNLGRSVIPVLLTAAEDVEHYTPTVREGIREVVRSHFEGLGAGGDDLSWSASPLLSGIAAGSSGEGSPGKRFIRLDSINVMGREPAPAASGGSAERPNIGAAPAKATGAAEITPALEAEAFKRVQVFYGTNRKPTGQDGSANSSPFVFPALVSLNSIAILALVICLACLMWQSPRSPLAIAMAGAGLAVLIGPQLPLASLLGRQLVKAQAVSYGGEFSDQVELGVCEVTIPAIHERGEVESPSIFRLEITADPEKHIVVQSIRPLESETFFGQLEGELGRKGRNILVFVHGYNVSFEDAARRTAQMSLDLKFPGAALFYSWPSQANWYQYRLDERNVELSVEPLKEFLLDVAKKSGATTINLVAHSMGNRALTSALKEIDASASTQGSLFNQVILAAPDIDATIFKNRIAPAIVTKARQITLYASSKDLALFASRQFNRGGPRAGDAGDGLVLVPGIETIDASAGDSSLLGHSYYGSSVSVLHDIEHLLKNEPARARPFLEPVPLGNMTYWLFHPPVTAEVPATEQLR